MKVRRIVTGTNKEGQSFVTSDGQTPVAAEMENVSGFGLALVWATGSTSGVSNYADPTSKTQSFVPEPGETRLLVITFPPDSVMANPSFDPVAAGGDFAKYLPGLAEKFEPESPGMHKTDTVDYGIVLDGEIWLELDNREIRKVSQGEIVIQNGTRHAWRNPGVKPATVAFVLIGTKPNTVAEI